MDTKFFSRLSSLLISVRGGGFGFAGRLLLPLLAAALFLLLPDGGSGDENLRGADFGITPVRGVGDLDSNEGVSGAPDIPVPEPRLRIDRFALSRLLLKTGGRALPEWPGYDYDPFDRLFSGLVAALLPVRLWETPIFFTCVIAESMPVRAGPFLA